MTTSFIALGSNLGDSLEEVSTAIDELAQLPETQLIKKSSLYLSAPLGPKGQNDYVNAVAWLETQLPPLELLDTLQMLEDKHLRERSIRWGSRTLDLDILLYGDKFIQHARLQVPHPQMVDRDFVLVPLSEICPALVLPCGRSLESLLSQCPRARLTRMTDGYPGNGEPV